MGRSAKLDEQPTPDPVAKIHYRLVELFPNRDQQTQCRELEWVDKKAYEKMLLDPLALSCRQNGEIGCTRNKWATPDDCESVTRRLAHGEDTRNAQSAKQSNVDQIRTHCTLASLTGQQAGAVQPPDAENRMSGGVEGRGAKSPLPHPIER